MHCKNCGRKCYLKTGYKYGYCYTKPECKKLYLNALRNDPDHKAYMQRYYSTEQGKQKRREIKQRYRQTDKGRQARRRERLKAKQKKRGQLNQ